MYATLKPSLDKESPVRSPLNRHRSEPNPRPQAAMSILFLFAVLMDLLLIALVKILADAG
jgi:hypothetical protein